MAHDYPRDDDGDSLRRVAAAGSDMSRPMAIDYMIAVPDEPAGNRVANQAEKLGYSTSVELDDESGEWICHCTKTMLATYDGVLAAQAELNAIATPHGG